VDNSFWLLGNGKYINFCNDSWCGTPLVDQFQLPPQLTLIFNNLSSIVDKVTIPLENSQDKLLWKHSDSGDLELEQAYSFKLQQYQDLQWAKLIWNPDIPP
jgi:hypothetical protein